MGLCRSQGAPRYDGFTNRVPKWHNPSMYDTPRRFTEADLPRSQPFTRAGGIVATPACWKWRTEMSRA